MGGYGKIFFLSSMVCSSSFALFQEESALFEGSFSKNYINRWAFQKLCDHIYDPYTNPYAWPTSPDGKTFDPSALNEGAIIFVRDVHRFMKTMHPKIQKSYIMVTAGESRDQVTRKHLAYLDDKKIIAWFAVHYACYETHPKLHPIPLGIYQDPKFYTSRKELTHQFALWRTAPKKKLLYSNFGDLKGLKPERAELGEQFDGAEYCFTVKERIPFLSYMEQMSRFKFSLSPRGYGPDTYRTWEALLVGSIPIVRTSQLDRLYADLPILIVDDWSKINKKFLEERYQEITRRKWPIEKLFIEYWEQQIRQVQSAFLLAKCKD